MEGQKKVLIGCTGSVASIKVPNIVDDLLACGVGVGVVTTAHALHFFDRGQIPEQVPVFVDEDEWTTWQTMGDGVLHIELRRRYDAFLVAPLGANSLAKIATGMCDNLLTCVARCWDHAEKPMLVAPAMNTAMWEHPVTAPQIQTLRDWSITVIPPISKTLACGDTGVGAMENHRNICSAVCDILGIDSDGRRVN